MTYGYPHVILQKRPGRPFSAADRFALNAFLFWDWQGVGYTWLRCLREPGKTVVLPIRGGW